MDTPLDNTTDCNSPDLSAAAKPWAQLLTVSEAATRLAISRSATYELIRTGELRSLQIGASRRVPLGAIEQFVSERVSPALVNPCSTRL